MTTPVLADTPPGVVPIVQIGIGDRYDASSTAGLWGTARWSTAGDDNEWGGQEPLWNDVTCDVLSVSTFSGREGSIDPFEIGTATVVVRNPAGWADYRPPTIGVDNLLTVRPGRQIRVGVEVGGHWETPPDAVTGVATGSITLSGGAAGLPVTYTDVLAEPFNNYTDNAWSLAGSPTIVAGRTGTAAALSSGTARADYSIATIRQSATLTVGFAWRLTNIAAARVVAEFRSDAGATQHNRLIASTTALALGAPSTIVATGAFTFAINTWYYIEAQVTLGDGTTGAAILRVNGTEIANVTGIDTKNAGTKTVYDTLRLGLGTAGVTLNYDDLYLTMGAGAPFQGDHTIP